MRFRLYREYGALNSKPVFDAFETGLKRLGHTVVQQDEDVAVIWSVLWRGRMQPNQHVHARCVANNTPIVVLEVGNLNRGVTWRVSLTNVNALGYFGNDVDLDQNRPAKLGVHLHPENNSRKSEILLATQHQTSLQWQNQPAMSDWIELTAAEIRKYTDRQIVVRPHPRCHVSTDLPMVLPKKLPNTYDGFDIDYGYHCVVNHNSGPSIQSVIHGTPVICDVSSLAYPVSNCFADIENISIPDRTDWFLKLTHTEWTLDEIAQSIPIIRLQFLK